MDYTWENLLPREFEIIACNFAEDMFPDYEWKLTGTTRDDNHDFFAQSVIGNKWGEAKHSKDAKKTISRSQWDPTLISAKLTNSVNDILLITCAHIPLPYIVRAFHMISVPIDNIYCINRYLLNEWYQKKKTKLSVFNSKYLLNTVLSKINVCDIDTIYSNDMQLYIFNSIEKNYLTIVENLILNCEYNFNIAIHSVEDKIKFKITLGPYFSLIRYIKVVNMSLNNKSYVLEPYNNKSFECDIFKGYSIVIFDIITLKAKEKAEIKYSLGKIEKIEKIYISETKEFNDRLLIELEKKIKNNNKRIIKTNYIPPHLLKRPNYKSFYIHFDCRNNNNFSQLCRLFSFFLTGIDFQELDEKIVKQTLFLGNYPEWLENIILGVFSDTISPQIILDNSQNIKEKTNHVSNNVVYIIENVSFLETDQQKIIRIFEELIRTENNDNVLILQKEKVPLFRENINDEIALVSIFETGIISDFINKECIGPKNDLIRVDIDKKLYYPSNSVQFNNVFNFFIDKTDDQKYEFLKRLIFIVSNQVWTSRVFDFILLLEGKISLKLYFDTIRSLRDVYYNRTDFYSAYNYSILLHKDENFDEYQKIDDMYKEADELNHCGSIIKSKILFEKVSEQALEMNDIKNINKGIEALTEVYNIRFWLLDVGNLEKEIDDTIERFFDDSKNVNMKGRELYPYYNCLNRKMVVQYLLNKYTDAENTFQEILTKVRLDNYTAFAYMDSARGLYNKNIDTAYERIKKATKYLEKLFWEGKEIRRYYDCLIEKAYVEFIIADHENRNLKVRHLKNAIYDAQKYGYNSIVEKSYFKLAACYLVLGKTEEAREYLNKIKNNPYFKDLPRNQFMYNELMKGYYHLKMITLIDTLNVSSYSCEVPSCVNFKCFNNIEENNSFYIDGRMW